MDCLGNQFLAGSRFTLNQNGSGGGDNLVHQGKNLPQGGAGTDNPLFAVIGLEFRFKPDIFSGMAPQFTIKPGILYGYGNDAGKNFQQAKIFFRKCAVLFIEGVEDAEELKKNSAKMAVAIGLALYDYD